MSLETHSLFRSADGPAPLPRVHVSPHGVKVGTFKDLTSNAVLPKLLPLVNVAGVYQPWADGDIRVHAFAAEDVQLVSGKTVQGNVIIRGQISRGDIPTPSGQTTNTLTAVLKHGLREMGIDIADLSGADLPQPDLVE